MQLINDYCTAIKINFACHPLKLFRRTNLTALMRFAKRYRAIKSITKYCVPLSEQSQMMKSSWRPSPCSIMKPLMQNFLSCRPLWLKYEYLKAELIQLGICSIYWIMKRTWKSTFEYISLKAFFAVKCNCTFHFPLSEGKRHCSLKVHGRYLDERNIHFYERSMHLCERTERVPSPPPTIERRISSFLGFHFSFCQRFANIGRVQKPRDFFIVEILKCFIKFSSATFKIHENSPSTQKFRGKPKKFRGIKTNQNFSL